MWNKILSYTALFLLLSTIAYPSVMGQTGSQMVGKDMLFVFTNGDNVTNAAQINFSDPDSFVDNRVIWRNFTDAAGIKGRVMCSVIPPMLYKLPINYTSGDVDSRGVLVSSIVTIQDGDFAGGASNWWVRMPIWSGLYAEINKTVDGVNNDTVFNTLENGSYPFSQVPAEWWEIDLYIHEIFNMQSPPTLNYTASDTPGIYPTNVGSLVGANHFNLTDGDNTDEIYIQDNYLVWSNYSYANTTMNSSYLGDFLYLNMHTPLYSGRQYIFTWQVRLNYMALLPSPLYEPSGLYLLVSPTDYCNDGITRTWVRCNDTTETFSFEGDLANEVVGVYGLSSGIAGARIHPGERLDTYVETDNVATGDHMVFAMPFINTSYSVIVIIQTYSGAWSISNYILATDTFNPETNNYTHIIMPFNYTGVATTNRWIVSLKFTHANLTETNTLYLYDGDIERVSENDALTLLFKSYCQITNVSSSDTDSYWFDPCLSLQKTQGIWNNVDLQVWAQQFQTKNETILEKSKKDSFSTSIFKFVLAIQGLSETASMYCLYAGLPGPSIVLGEVALGLYMFTGVETGPITKYIGAPIRKIIGNALKSAASWINEYIVEPIIAFVQNIIEKITIFIDIMIDLIDIFLKIVLVVLSLVGLFYLTVEFKKLFKFPEILACAGATAAMVYASSSFDEFTAKITKTATTIASAAAGIPPVGALSGKKKEQPPSEGGE